MLEMYAPTLQRAEGLARDGGSIEEILDTLRGLSLEDFGLLFISLPNTDYPALSRRLPPMASEKVQKQWTGAAGIDLYRQTVSFVRLVQSNFAHYKRQGLFDHNILDFGCGYGRIIRMLYYFSNPDRICGADAWKSSLDLCVESRLPGTFIQSAAVPESLPVGDNKFDLIFAFSVFTHLSPLAANACLQALRKHIAPDGLLMLTIRPIEFWRYYDGVRNTHLAADLEKAHRETGFAYLPHGGEEGKTYGDASLALSTLAVADWQVLGSDRSVIDPYQVMVVLTPR